MNIINKTMTELLKSIDPELFEGKPINIFGTPEEPLFLTKEICDLFGYTNSCRIYKEIPVRYKQKLKINGGIYNIINESGLYWMIIRCNKPCANKLQEYISENIHS